MRAAGPIDVQDVSFVSADQGWALGRGELVSTTDGAASWQPAGLDQVVSLETAAGWVWSIAGAQP